MSVLESHNLPLVTVVIPCYNHSEYIAKTIESVIRQDYSNIELIIVDDGSSDDSAKVIESYVASCNERFVNFKFYSRENIGLSATLNEMLEWATGKYFSGIASDDILLHDKISTQVAYLEQHHSCEILAGYVQKIDKNNNVIDVPSKLEVKSFSFNDVYLQRYSLPAPTTMYRTSTLKAIGYKTGFVLEDWYMLLAILKNGGEAIQLPKLATLYRIHEGNTHGNISLMFTEQVRVIEYFKSHVSVIDYRRIYGRVLSAYIFKSIKSKSWRQIKLLINDLRGQFVFNLISILIFIFLLPGRLFSHFLKY